MINSKQNRISPIHVSRVPRASLSLSLSRLRVNRCLCFLLALLALLARRLAALVLLHTLVNNQHLGWSLGTLHRLGRRLYPR